jgi:hypothetical protein
VKCTPKISEKKKKNHMSLYLKNQKEKKKKKEEKKENCKENKPLPNASHRSVRVKVRDVFVRKALLGTSKKCPFDLKRIFF